MPLNAAIQRIQRLMGFNGVLTDGAGGSAQTLKSNGFRPAGVRGHTIVEQVVGVLVCPLPQRLLTYLLTYLLKREESRACLVRHTASIKGPRRAARVRVPP